MDELRSIKRRTVLWQMRIASNKSALLVIDVQKAFDEIEAEGNRRNNPDALTRIAGLLAAFRKAGAAVIHIRHASLEPASRLRASESGYAVMDLARENPGEPVLVKHVNAAFIGTDLEARLRLAGIDTVVIAGVTTNHCVETTTRMAGNLGFSAKLVRDAAWTFGRTGADGEVYTAEQVHAMTLANLKDEFAEIVTAAEVMHRLQAA